MRRTRLEKDIIANNKILEKQQDILIEKFIALDPKINVKVNVSDSTNNLAKEKLFLLVFR